MRACPKCGQRIPSSERYCPYCGHMKNIPLPLDAYKLGFIENFKHCVVHKYANFEGRASRSEYWHFMLVYQLIIAII
ncbi:MAG: zinc-ribbon domain-containing protein, partial [Veillonella sp.]|nr:zinc-ribbon domain-containing protein [Veillonella sp.]